MFKWLRKSVIPTKGGNLSRSFSRLGWAGFWLQILFGSLPVIVFAYYYFFSQVSTSGRKGLPFVEYLAIANLCILLFTIFWSYRYTLLGRSLAEPSRQPSGTTVVNTVWTGVVASTIGMLFSMVAMLIESAHLLFSFLKMPQAGVPVIQTTNAETATWVSAVDMMSLFALTLTLTAEMVVLVFSLWLLFRTSDLDTHASA